MLEVSRKAITPFWNRIPQFFLYPLKPAALTVLVGVVVLFAVLPMSFFGWLLRLVLMVFFTKYCYEVLEQTSEGRLRPPQLSSDLLTQRYELPFKQVGIFIVLGLISVALAQSLGEWAAGIFTFVTNIALAASIMVLATTSSLISALNPSLVFGLIARVGWPYLALVGLLMLLPGGTLAITGLLAERVSPLVLLAIIGFSAMYFSVISFHLMGYVLYQYHERLGFTPTEVEDEDQDDPELELFRQFMREQNYPAALEELRGLLNRRWGDLELHRTTHKLAKLMQNKDTLIRHGREYLGVLLERNRIREAMEVYQDLTAAEPSFRPELPDQYLPIAQMLRESRRPKPAVGLINGFHTRFPDSEQTPALYLLVAKIFHEDLGDDARAGQILRFVAKQYPGHGLTGTVEHYLRVIEATKVKPSGSAV